MTETWYMAMYEKIMPVEIKRETNRQVILPNGRRENKVSDYKWYTKTFHEAKSLMIDQYQREFDRAQMRLDSLSLRLDAAKRLHE